MGRSPSGGRLEQLDQVARAVAGENLCSAGPGHDLVAERLALGLEAGVLTVEVVDDEVDAVPTSGAWSCAVGHRPAGRALRPEITAPAWTKISHKAAPSSGRPMARAAPSGPGDLAGQRLDASAIGGLARDLTRDRRLAVTAAATQYETAHARRRAERIFPAQRHCRPRSENQVSNGSDRVCPGRSLRGTRDSAHALGRSVDVQVRGSGFPIPNLAPATAPATVLG